MAFSWKRANPVGSLELVRSHHELFGLAAVAFLGYLAHAVLPSVSVLYMGYRYGWGTAAVGLMMAGVGIAAMIVQGGADPPDHGALRRTHDIAHGLLCGALGFLCTAWRRRDGCSASAFRHGLLGMYRSGHPGIDDPSCQRRGAGTASRRHREHQRVDRPDRPDSLHANFRTLHRPQRRVAHPRRTVPACFIMLFSAAVIAWRATKGRE